MTDQPIHLTSRAAARVATIARKKGDPDLKLRLMVEGGGCAGFQYRFDLESQVAPDDLAVQTDGVTLLVDPASLAFLSGAEVDYVEHLGGAAFRVNNPNAASGCGCGASFAV